MHSGQQPKSGKPPAHWSINDIDGLDYYNTEVDLISKIC